MPSEITITKDEDTGRVIEAFISSGTKEGIFYQVSGKIFGSEETWECTCPAGINKRSCKHVKAVKEEMDE